MRKYMAGHKHLFTCFGWHSFDTPSSVLCKKYGWSFHVNMQIRTISESTQGGSGYSFRFPMFTVRPGYLGLKNPYHVVMSVTRQLNETYGKWWAFYTYPDHGDTDDIIHRAASYFLYTRLAGYCIAYQNRWVKEVTDTSFLQFDEVPDKFWAVYGNLDPQFSYDGVDTKLDSYGRDMEVRKKSRITSIRQTIKEKKW